MADVTETSGSVLMETAKCNDNAIDFAKINIRSLKGPVVNEVDEGRPCLACKDKCRGFTPHDWRNTCRFCKCMRDIHDICHLTYVNVWDRIGWKQPEDSTPPVNEARLKKMGYTWIPSGLTDKQVVDYMEQLDNNKIPRLNSAGEKYRDIQLIVQLPKQDLADEYCRHLEADVQHKAFEEFRKNRDEQAMDIGVVKKLTGNKNMSCAKCDGEIEANDIVIFAPKYSDGSSCWHPACFVCTTCEELLVDLVYCYKDGVIYCQRHFAEQMKPRCAACDELIFSGEYTKAMDQDWHSGHFACWNCDKSLTGHRYILRDDHPFCIECYEKLFANVCEECKIAIGTDSKDLSYKDKHWHEKCFKCSDCERSLVDQPFASKNDSLYCADCHDTNFAARCDGCGQVFKAGMKKFEYQGKQWHDQCFCCKICKQPMGSKSFIPKDQDVICVTCYEEQYAQRCSKCNGVISKGGITYKSSPWHKECFVCANCKKQLAGEKFTSREDQPYCADCFADLFAKKCSHCTKPITGLGGTKFISFEERHWHSECFVCCKCQVSLVGRGFLSDGDDLLCPECGKA